MENNTNLTSNAILNLKYILGIKNDYVLADKLDIARNTISGMKKRNSSGALFEKVCELEENSLSFDFLLYSNRNTLIEDKRHEPIKKDVKLEEQFELFKSFLNWRDETNK